MVRCDAQLESGAWRKGVRVDEGCLHGSRLRPVVAVALPEIACDAGAALGDVDVGFPALVDLELAGRHVWPDVRSVRREVGASQGKHLFGTRGAVFVDRDLEHVTPSS